MYTRVIIAWTFAALLQLAPPVQHDRSELILSSATAASLPDDLPGLRTSKAPWPIEMMQLEARLRMIGLPALRREGTAFHIHQHLDIFINGRPVPVPTAIGINPVAGFISPIHTHDNSGAIHIESFEAGRYTLGQFFDVWGVRFTQTCIGAYCNAGERVLRVYVNGKLVHTDPREIELANNQEIVVTYGTAKELPNPIPSEFHAPEQH